MANTFLQALHSGRVLLMDGTMGTELQRAGMQPGECYEIWNLTHPESVLAIHRAYVEAGAEVLLTNTFQANPPALAKHRLGRQLQEICKSSVGLARTAAGSNKFVLEDMSPFLDISGPELPKSFKLPWNGADGVLVETCSDVIPSLSLAMGLLKASDGDSPRHSAVMLSFAFLRDEAGELRTFHRFTPEAIARRVGKAGCYRALGVNCGLDITIDDCAEIIRRYRAVTNLPLFARPNAGTPTKIENQWVYPYTPEQMAAELPKLLEAGATMIGGCCGTTPAHIAAFRRVIDVWNAKKQTART